MKQWFYDKRRTLTRALLVLLWALWSVAVVMTCRFAWPIFAEDGQGTIWVAYCVAQWVVLSMGGFLVIRAWERNA